MKKGIINYDSDPSWTFLDGSKRGATILESMTIGRGKYLPGWQWSKHVGPTTGSKSKKHMGYIIEGEMMIKSSNGKETKVAPGEAFEVGEGHDAWVLGDKTCIALDFSALKSKNETTYNTV